nr:hypothetical protein [Tanacetum cinerariifolium]
MSLERSPIICFEQPESKYQTTIYTTLGVVDLVKGQWSPKNRVGNANPSQARQVKCYNSNGIRHIARSCTQPKQAQENGVALDEEQLLFLADNVFQADDCVAIDSDVDEAPTAQTMFMANLLTVDRMIWIFYLRSYDLDILSEVHDHDHYQDAVCEHHEEHAMHENVQLNQVVDSHVDYMSDTNMIPYDQYVKDNAMLEDTLEIVEITRRKMNDKMKDPECVTRKVKIAPHDYSKENFLVTFKP